MAKASDNLFPKLILVEGSAPASPAAGNQDLFIDSADHKLKRVNSSGTVTSVESTGGLTAYTAYTPAITATTTNPTLGTGGSITGRYCQIGSGSGSHVEGTAYVQFGSSGAAAGSGSYRISVPVNIAAPGPGYCVGYAYMLDSSSGATALAMLGYVSATTVQLNGTAAIGNAFPWTWAAGDNIVLHFAYEAA